MSETPRASGAGIGWRRELASELLRSPHSADFVEVVAETCFAQPSALREARAIAELWPVVPHGVKLSLASADGLETWRARRLGALARELSAPAVSEHVALTRGGATEIGHLTAVPFTRAMVRVVARNVAALRRHLPDVPLLLENIAWSFRPPGDEMGEGDFHAEVAEATGCPLLLDLANLYANALNSGVPPARLLESCPLERVGMVHIAGGAWEDGFYADTHAHAVPEEVFALLAALLARSGAVPVVLERDARFPALAELAADLARVRGLLAGRPAVLAAPPSAAVDEGPPEPVLLEQQVALAALLTRPDAPRAAECLGIPRSDVLRTRAILLHKRVDEALPLLPQLSERGGGELDAVALATVRATPRAARAAGIVDAFAIARAASREPPLAPAARLDLLELRSRFTRRGRPRLWTSLRSTLQTSLMEAR